MSENNHILDLKKTAELTYFKLLTLDSRFEFMWQKCGEAKQISAVTNHPCFTDGGVAFSKLHYLVDFKLQLLLLGSSCPFILSTRKTSVFVKLRLKTKNWLTSK